MASPTLYPQSGPWYRSRGTTAMSHCSARSSSQLTRSRALSGLSLEGEERDILREIRKGNREGKQEDAVARSATELRRSKGKSVWSIGVVRA